MFLLEGKFLENFFVVGLAIYNHLKVFVIHFAFDYSAQRYFLVFDFLRNFTLELSQLLSEVTLTVIKSSLDFFDIDLGVNMWDQRLFYGHHFLNRASIDNLFLDGIIVKSKFTHLRFNLFFLLINYHFDKVSCLINISLPLIREMPQLLLLSIYFIQSFFTANLIFLQLLLNLLLFWSSLEVDIAPDDIKLLHNLLFDLKIEWPYLFLIHFFSL